MGPTGSARGRCWRLPGRRLFASPGNNAREAPLSRRTCPLLEGVLFRRQATVKCSPRSTFTPLVRLPRYSAKQQVRRRCRCVRATFQSVAAGIASRPPQ